MRLFVAVSPPRQVLDHLDDAVAPARDDTLVWTLTAAWHLTLAFYGDVAAERRPDLERRLERAARRHGRLDLQLMGAGRFGTTVLWAGVVGDVTRMRRLAQSVHAAGRRVGLELDDVRRFRPHVTLARSSRQDDLRPYVQLLAGYEGLAWTADEIALIRSHLNAGPGGRSVYETLRTFPLSRRMLA